MTEEIKQIPDILTQVSKEKFRRRLLIVSRIMAFCLILAIIYIGYVNMTYGDDIKKNPCYYCGFEYGKKCDFIYFTPEMKQSSQEFLIGLGQYNSNMSDRVKYISGQQDPINLSFLNTLIINNDTNNS